MKRSTLGFLGIIGAMLLWAIAGTIAQGAVDSGPPCHTTSNHAPGHIFLYAPASKGTAYIYKGLYFGHDGADASVQVALEFYSHWNSPSLGVSGTSVTIANAKAVLNQWYLPYTYAYVKITPTSSSTWWFCPGEMVSTYFHGTAGGVTTQAEELKTVASSSVVYPGQWRSSTAPLDPF